MLSFQIPRDFASSFSLGTGNTEKENVVSVPRRKFGYLHYLSMGKVFYWQTRGRNELEELRQ